jgi:hypothetical protein
MEKIKSSRDLQNAIFVLEAKKKNQQMILENQFESTYESLKSMNLIKSAFQGILESANMKNNLINSAIGLGAGIVSKKIVIGQSKSWVKKILGTVLEVAIAGIFVKNAGKIKTNLRIF